jgi:hypothetical protein
VSRVTSNALYQRDGLMHVVLACGGVGPAGCAEARRCMLWDATSCRNAAPLSRSHSLTSSLSVGVQAMDRVLQLTQFEHFDLEPLCALLVCALTRTGGAQWQSTGAALCILPSLPLTRHPRIVAGDAGDAAAGGRLGGGREGGGGGGGGGGGRSRRRCGGGARGSGGEREGGCRLRVRCVCLLSQRACTSVSVRGRRCGGHNGLSLLPLLTVRVLLASPKPGATREVAEGGAGAGTGWEDVGDVDALEEGVGEGSEVDAPSQFVHTER